MFLRTVHGKIIFEGRYKTIRRCLEAAVREGVDLRAVDLRRAYLSHANLDEAYMPQACLWGAKLAGTDMSGINLEGADLRAANLKDACLSESTLRYADFSGAYFSDTLVNEADMSHCRFSCPSFFSLNLSELKKIHQAVYCHRGEADCMMSHPPLVLKGFPQAIVCFDAHVLIGSVLIDAAKADPEIGRFIKGLKSKQQHNHGAFKDRFCNLIKLYNPKIGRVTNGS